MTDSRGCLAGLRILDLSRVLAGPSCTQLLADLGAEVIKVERPGLGDETRHWGPPFVKDADGNDTGESAYYLCCNRNKRSITIDMSRPEGQALVKDLLRKSDVLIENYKVGGLRKFGLGYEDLRDEFPRLVYCSISGYGQTGPYANRPGYDMAAQAMGGLLSMTGEEGGPPVKVPVAINDIMSGMYATVAILAALRNRDATGHGQHIDVALLDVQVAWLANQALNYLIGGKVPVRLGTGHPNTVPYQAFDTQDGTVVLACNNDDQFRRFCELVGRDDLPADERFATNAARVNNRRATVEVVQEIIRERSTAWWLNQLEKTNIMCVPVQTLDEVFEDPQVLHREMKISMPHPAAGSGKVDLLGNPLKLSDTPVRYRRQPPMLGENTEEVLEEVLNMNASQIASLRENGAI